MYIVVFDDHPGYFGPFDTRDDGQRYIDDNKEDGGADGRVVALITPRSLNITLNQGVV